MDGTKHDQSKPAFHLIDARFDLEVLCDGPSISSFDQNLRQWARRDSRADLRRVFWAVVAKFGTDNLPRTARLELARVLHFGAEKYSPNNWKGGFKWSRLWRAAYGHIEAHKAGDIYDDETGFLHLSHALCCLMFLIVHERDGLGEDDRAEIWPEVAPTDEDPQTDVAVDLVGFTQENVRDDVAEWTVPSGQIISLSKDPAKGWSCPGHISQAEYGFIKLRLPRMRAISWPPQIQYESGCGVHFKLLSVDRERAAWRCVVSGAHGYIKRDKTWHWLSSSLSCWADNNATDCETTRADLVAASWPD